MGKLGALERLRLAQSSIPVISIHHASVWLLYTLPAEAIPDCEVAPPHSKVQFDCCSHSSSLLPRPQAETERMRIHLTKRRLSKPSQRPIRPLTAEDQGAKQTSVNGLNP